MTYMVGILTVSPTCWGPPLYLAIQPQVGAISKMLSGRSSCRFLAWSRLYSAFTQLCSSGTSLSLNIFPVCQILSQQAHTAPCTKVYLRAPWAQLMQSEFTPL